MKDKILIKLSVPEIDLSFDIFIPVNELIWRVKQLMIKGVNDLSGNSLNLDGEYVLLNKLTNQIYSNNVTVYDTDIRNASELILLVEKKVSSTLGN